MLARKHNAPRHVPSLPPPACSVVFDPRQCTPATKVALVRFEPLAPPDAAAAAGRASPAPAAAAAAEQDAGKVAESIIAALRAKAPELHGAKVNVEKTGAEVRRCSQGRRFAAALPAAWLPCGEAEVACARACWRGLRGAPLALSASPFPAPGPPAPQVCLFLSNLRGDDASDEGLRATCKQHGALERCFVVGSMRAACPSQATGSPVLLACGGHQGASRLPNAATPAPCTLLQPTPPAPYPLALPLPPHNMHTKPQMRNPSGDSKGYAFVEFTLPGAAAACKEAWNKAGEAQRPQLQRDAAGAGAWGGWAGGRGTAACARTCAHPSAPCLT